jgi:hypothetical protein
MTQDDLTDAATKVPAVTLGFWVIKILASTLGETGGDTVSMSWLGETTPDAGQSGPNGQGGIWASDDRSADLASTGRRGSMSDFDIEAIRAEVRTMEFVRGTGHGPQADSGGAGKLLSADDLSRCFPMEERESLRQKVNQGPGAQFRTGAEKV